MNSPTQLTFLANSPKPGRVSIIIPDHRQMNTLFESFQNWANEKIFCKDWCIDLQLYPLLC